MASHSFEYQRINSIEDLAQEEKNILKKTKELCKNAYAPYSNFLVGSIVRLNNGEMIKGVNIENASYPVGICAERAALSAAIANFPKEKINTIAISYLSQKGNVEPLFPCGMCRQFILECETRNEAPIKIILSAQEGEVIIINKASDLLPFGFKGTNL